MDITRYLDEEQQEELLGEILDYHEGCADGKVRFAQHLGLDVEKEVVVETAVRFKATSTFRSEQELKDALANFLSSGVFDRAFEEYVDNYDDDGFHSVSTVDMRIVPVKATFQADEWSDRITPIVKFGAA